MRKLKVNFKIYHFTKWTINNYNTYIVQYLKKQRQSDKKIDQLIEHKHEK